MTCPNCRGRGWYAVRPHNDEPPEQELCELCSGSGEAPEAERVSGSGVAKQCAVCSRYFDKPACPYCEAMDTPQQ